MNNPDATIIRKNDSLSIGWSLGGSGDNSGRYPANARGLANLKPTHRITLTGFAQERGRVAPDEVILVTMCGASGPAYTKQEWLTGSPADFERTSDGSWTFQGEAFSGKVEEVTSKGGQAHAHQPHSGNQQPPQESSEV